jgi:hypothetical protein
MGLPIVVEPGTETNLIIILSDRKVDGLRFVNNENKRSFWPGDYGVWPPENTGFIKLANHGDVAAFDILTIVGLRIGTTGDLVSYPYPLPLIPTLQAGGAAATFYVVNESAYGVVVDLPDYAFAQVQGQQNQVRITLEKRTMTPSDRFPILTPSLHKWVNGQLVDPDVRRKSKAQRPRQKS